MFDAGSNLRLAPGPQQEIRLPGPSRAGDWFDDRTIAEDLTVADKPLALPGSFPSAGLRIPTIGC